MREIQDTGNNGKNECKQGAIKVKRQQGIKITQEVNDERSGYEVMKEGNDIDSE